MALDFYLLSLLPLHSYFIFVELFYLFAFLFLNCFLLPHGLPDLQMGQVGFDHEQFLEDLLILLLGFKIVILCNIQLLNVFFLHP